MTQPITSQIVSQDTLDRATLEFLRRQARSNDWGGEPLSKVAGVLAQDGPFKLLVKEICKQAEEKPDEAGVFGSILMTCVFQVGFLAGLSMEESPGTPTEVEGD